MTLPLALFLIDETFDIIADLLWIVGKFIPKHIYYRYLYSGFDGISKSNQKFIFSPCKILELCRELLNELRRHGRYSLVEAEVGKGHYRQRVSVEFL